MGGILRADAKARIAQENPTPTTQEFFEGTPYEQDKVWTRSSRAILQVILVVSYIFVALSYTLTVAVTTL